ncbi:uncharacterized protein LOC117173646 [Belonocnema kinseyi]|uniref:uncharacterized protein LOC117173646 n=1 Tax=Belonocnema kinseyi TaxID=2817044 RepID=UPI00143D9971|nr:uncharacterized protein LOC117173646 [Belonocnema kinseyi]
MGKRKNDLASPGEWTDVTRKKNKSEILGKSQSDEGKENQRRSKEVTMKKKSQRKTDRRQRREAVLIKLAPGKTYAEVLGDIKAKMTPEESEAHIWSIHRTRNGDVLIELKMETKNAAAFGEALEKHLGEMGTMKNLVPKVTLKLRDLDCVTTKEDVEIALKRDLGDKLGDAKVSVTRPNRREQVLAIVEVGEKAASQLLETARIKVGWINSRVRNRISIDRCFRCLGYGHQSRDCKGPDRSGLCYRCGLGGHPEKLNHIPGSGG